MNNEESMMNFEEALNSLDFNNLFSTIEESMNYLFEEARPKIFYRKFRTNKGIKRRYMIKTNPIANYILDTQSLNLRFLRRLYG